MLAEATKIDVKFVETSSYSLKDGDTFLTCDHEFAEITPPCCSTRGSSGYIECGCGGMYSVYCPDCDYMNMPDNEVDELIEAFVGEPPEDY